MNTEKDGPFNLRLINVINRIWKTKTNQKRNLSRRKFLGSTATVAALSMMPISMFGKSSPEPKAVKGTNPDSKFGGVQIGAITYSWRDQPGGLENIIKYCKETGISSVELMSGDLEEYLGAPKNPMAGMFGPPHLPHRLQPAHLHRLPAPAGTRCCSSAVQTS